MGAGAGDGCVCESRDLESGIEPTLVPLARA